MESRIRVLLLTLAVTLCGGCAHLHWPFHRHAKAPPTQAQQEATADAAAAAAEAAPPPTVIEPQGERRKVKGPKIRSKNVELGASFGEISIQSDPDAPLTGLRLDCQ